MKDNKKLDRKRGVNQREKGNISGRDRSGYCNKNETKERWKSKDDGEKIYRLKLGDFGPWNPRTRSVTDRDHDQEGAGPKLQARIKKRREKKEERGEKALRSRQTKRGTTYLYRDFSATSASILPQLPPLALYEGK